jgi:hypothetical protein
MPVERLVTARREALVLQLLPGDLADSRARRSRPSSAIVLASLRIVAPMPPTRIDVDVADAAVVEVGPEVVGVPGRAGVARVRVARPEGEAQPAS